MRIGLTGGGSSVDKIVQQAQQAEADGFTSLWYASSVAGDPLVAMAIAGRATTTIELGTAVLQTYPCHPLLQANRVAAAANAMGRRGLALGLGPSHEPVVRDVLGLSYDHPGRNTEEYLRIVSDLLNGVDVDFDGTDWTTHSTGRMVVLGPPRVTALVGRLGTADVASRGPVRRRCRVVDGLGGGHRVTHCTRAAEVASLQGRPTPRIVAGLPVVVHDDVDEARAAIAAMSTSFAGMANYQRIIRVGGGTDCCGCRGDRRRVGGAPTAQRPYRSRRHRRVGTTCRSGRRPRSAFGVAATDAGSLD